MMDCSLDQARSEFLRHGSPCSSGARPAGFDQSSNAAWECLSGYVRHRMEDGTVMVPDSLGRWHTLLPLHARFSDSDFTACAFDDKGGWAVVSPPLMSALASASFGIWCHPGFEPGVGDPTLVTLPPIAPGVPFGFEEVALRNSNEPGVRAMLGGRRNWLDRAVRQLCPVRREMAAFTAWHAARWIWAHEAGHLFAGHHLLEIGSRVDIRARFGKPFDDSTPKTEPELGLEILADRFATRLIAAGTKDARDAHLRILAIGALLALSLFEVAHVMSGRPWVTTTHPGAWFRAQLLLDELEAAAGRRIGWLPMLTRLAQALGHCGLWLEPAIEGGHDDLADSFVEEILASLTPHHEVLRRSGALPVRDMTGASADRYTSESS